jgi:hypothetical protein
MQEIKWHEVLANMFTDRRFREIAPDLYQARIGDAKVGVAVAKRLKKHHNHLLTADNLERRLIDTKRGLVVGKSLDFAFVVAANKVSFRNVFVGYRDAEELYEILKDVTPKPGDYGAYWLLKPDLTPAFIHTTDDIDDIDEDFM